MAAAVIALFIFGALNNIGIGSYAPTAVYIVKSLNVSMLQWVVAVVVFLAGLDIIIREILKKTPLEEKCVEEVKQSN